MPVEVRGHVERDARGPLETLLEDEAAVMAEWPRPALQVCGEPAPDGQAVGLDARM